MVKTDNPVRQARLRTRLSQNQLANRAGISRMTLLAIEEGQTRNPDAKTVGRLARALGTPPPALYAALRSWNDKRVPASYSPQARDIALRRARTFQQLRETLSESISDFAGRLLVARATIRGYEEGQRKQGLPDSIEAALLAVGFTPEDLDLIRALPPK